MVTLESLFAFLKTNTPEKRYVKPLEPVEDLLKPVAGRIGVIDRIEMKSEIGPHKNDPNGFVFVRFILNEDVTERPLNEVSFHINLEKPNPHYKASPAEEKKMLPLFEEILKSQVSKELIKAFEHRHEELEQAMALTEKAFVKEEQNRAHHAKAHQKTEAAVQDAVSMAVAKAEDFLRKYRGNSPEEPQPTDPPPKPPSTPPSGASAASIPPPPVFTDAVAKRHV